MRSNVRFDQLNVTSSRRKQASPITPFPPVLLGPHKAISASSVLCSSRSSCQLGQLTISGLVLWNVRRPTKNAHGQFDHTEYKSAQSKYLIHRQEQVEARAPVALSFVGVFKCR